MVVQGDPIRMLKRNKDNKESGTRRDETRGHPKVDSVSHRLWAGKVGDTSPGRLGFYILSTLG